MRIVTLVASVMTAAAVIVAVALSSYGPAGTAVTGPVMTVNGTADNNIRDDFLTLREAMLLATGGLSVSGLAEGECGQISGAQWTPPTPPLPSLCISAPVPGANSADTIRFDPTMFDPATITIDSQLPWLSTSSDTLDGSAAEVTIRASSRFGSCIIIDSDGNTIRGLMITNCFTAVSIYANGNLIGGGAADERNVISGNSNGVWIAGNSNVLKGNRIGTDASGANELRNSGDGIHIDGGALNIVGGSTADDRNVISGNSIRGVWLSDSTATGNVVKGNYIGTDASGATAIPNGHGVLIDHRAQGNTVGGDALTDRNVISGNEDVGVLVEDTDTEGNVVRGNYIGTDASGTGALPNADSGVKISGGAGNNTVRANLISGNGDAGVIISGTDTAGNLIKGNHIGTDASASVAVGNVTGIWIGNGAQDNKVGGNAPGERNVISGNGRGVSVNGTTSSGNQILGNYIGTDAAGTAAIGNGDGIAIYGSQNTVVGGISNGASNVISGNSQAGVAVRNGAEGTVVLGNYIGVDAGGTAALGNRNGLIIYSHNTTVGGINPGEGNIIAFSNTEGISVDGNSSTGNTIRGNSIHSNGERAIHNSDGGNSELTPPVITGFGSISGTACANCTIDVYSDAEDEGRIYEGATTADAAGNWTLIGQLFGPNATATATDLDGNTSEFSQPASVPTPATPSPTPVTTTSPTPTSTPTPVTTATPTPTPTPGAAPVQGDNDCDNDVDAVDALKNLQHVAAIPYQQEDGCQKIGSALPAVAPASEPPDIFGDVDCDHDVDAVDALKILQFVAAMAFTQTETCTDIGQPLSGHQ